MRLCESRSTHDIYFSPLTMIDYLASWDQYVNVFKASILLRVMELLH